MASAGPFVKPRRRSDEYDSGQYDSYSEDESSDAGTPVSLPNYQKSHRRSESSSRPKKHRRYSGSSHSSARSRSRSQPSVSPDFQSPLQDMGNKNNQRKTSKTKPKAPPNVAQPPKNVSSKQAEMEREMAKLREELAKAREETTKIAAEKTEIAEFAAKSGGGSGKKSGKSGNNDAYRRHYKKVISTQLFRKYKFCSNDKQVKRFTRKVLETLPIYKEMLKDEKRGEEKIKEWIADNQATVMQELNKHRSYVTNNLRRDFRAYYDAHGKKLPTVTDMVACLERIVDLKDPKQLELFTFYVDRILAHAPGNDHDFKVDKRYYAKISEAAPKDSPEDVYMTPSTEAFAVLAFENNREGWLKQFALKDKFPARTIVHLKNELPEGDKVEKPPEKHNIPKDADKNPKYQFLTGGRIGVISQDFKGQWTKSDCGSLQTGGWVDEGLKRFNDLVRRNKNARITKQCGEVEQQILDKLRADHGITSENHKEHLAMKKRKRAKDGEEDEDELENTWSEDEEAANDDENNADDNEEDDDENQQEEEEGGEEAGGGET